MIRRLIYWVLLLFVCMGAHAQFKRVGTGFLRKRKKTAFVFNNPF